RVHRIRRDFPTREPAADASFNLSTSVPSGTETFSASTNSRTVYDVAGNSAGAGPIGFNKIDKKAPSITITAPAAASYTINQAASATYSHGRRLGRDPLRRTCRQRSQYQHRLGGIEDVYRNA